MSPHPWARAIAAIVLIASARPGAQAPKSVAFTNVSTLPMTGNQVVPNQTVIVTGDRITAVGPSKTTTVPNGATVVDGQGKFLMPGLGEMHGHIPPPTQPRELIDNVLFLYVAAGVTTVRGMQGAPGQLDLREAAKRGDIIAPNLYLAGPQFGGNTVKSPEDAVARVRQQKSEGWDLLKVQEGLSPAAYDAMAKTAKDVGIRFGGHVPNEVGVLRAIEAGQDTFDHIDGFIEQLDGRAKVVDEKAVQDLAQRTRKAGAWIVPTMVVWETLQGPVTLESRTAWPELRYLPAAQIDQWTKGLGTRLKDPQYNAEQARLHIDNRMRILKALHEGGVGLLLGSDAPQQFNVPGFSLHREMQRMADAGISAYEVVKSGTANVGVYFKDQDRFGTIAAGQRADLILVDANPLQNLANLEKRSGVMVRGRWLPSSEIEARLAKIAQPPASASARQAAAR
jgi:imidazolonepropionase-like amidohydrolase